MMLYFYLFGSSPNKIKPAQVESSCAHDFVYRCLLYRASTDVHKVTLAMPRLLLTAAAS